METHLRPLTLGEILDRTTQLYRTNFWLFAGIASVYSGALLLLNLILIGAQEYLRARDLAGYLVVAGGIGIVFQFLVSFLVGGVAVAANNRAVGWVHLGEPATIRGAYASILPRTGRYVWLMTIITVILWTPMLLAYGGYVFALYRVLGSGALKALTGSAPPLGQQAAMTFVLITLGFILVAGLAGTWAIVMGLRYALAIAASVVEDLAARQAMRRSVALSKGARGRIFLLGLLVLVIQMGIVTITQIPFMMMSFKHHGELAAGARITQQFVAFLTNTFIGPMYAIGLTLFYYDQRVRKEGYDIEWMMQAAGLVQAPGKMHAAERVQAEGQAEVQPPDTEIPAAAPEPDQPEHA
jgi:hypothetical protein